MDPLSYLYGLEQFGIKFGLENISTLVEALGHPERAFRSVHIAGTNGKGSVTAMVDAALRAAGHRSARYTSPHLVDLAERFVIDGRPIGQDTMVAAIADVRDAVDALRARGALVVQPTFFEVTTAVAFTLFRRAGIDLAVIEVGLGGRLDATNVLTPLVTAITSIAFDHQRYLGSTLRDIALEKGGIIKPGVPVVIGELADEADAALATVASARDAELIRAKPGDVDGMAVGLLGAHQRANAAVAVRVLQTVDALGISVPRSAIAAGLAHPHWPGRLEWRRLPDGRELLLDAAHNPAGAAALASYLTGLTDRNGPSAKPPLVFAVMRDKDIAGMLSVLSPVIGSLVVTRASTPRSADPVELSAIARRVAPMMNITVEPSPDRALAAAWRDAPWIVVAGSIFLLGDVMKLIDAP